MSKVLLTGTVIGLGLIFSSAANAQHHSGYYPHYYYADHRVYRGYDDQSEQYDYQRETYGYRRETYRPRPAQRPRPTVEYQNEDLSDRRTVRRSMAQPVVNVYVTVQQPKAVRDKKVAGPQVINIINKPVVSTNVSPNINPSSTSVIKGTPKPGSDKGNGVCKTLGTIAGGVLGGAPGATVGATVGEAANC
jgi:hypothetical protein